MLVEHLHQFATRNLVFHDRPDRLGQHQATAHQFELRLQVIDDEAAIHIHFERLSVALEGPAGDPPARGVAKSGAVMPSRDSGVVGVGWRRK